MSGRKVAYTNSYRVGPDPDKKFSPVRVSELVSTVLEDMLSGKQYDSDLSQHLSREVSKAVLERIRGELPYERYKVVVQTTIGEKRGQTTRVATRSLWNVDTDNFASADYHNNSLFASCVVFGFYYA